MNWLRGVLRASVDGLRAQPRAFLLAFAVLAAMTVFAHVRAPLGPGQDYHYHLMVAALNARPAGDAIRALYKVVNPLDANTLIYTLAFPLEKLMGPVRAFQLTVTGVSFLGLPLATTVALRRLGRAPWGALLAFPLAYSPTWFEGGFMPFVSSAPFFVLATAEFFVAHASSGRRARSAVIAGAVFATLTFLAHGHAFMWLGIQLGLATLLLAAGQLARLPADGTRALGAALRVGLRSLALIAPALLFFARWYFATHYGASSASSNQTWQPIDAPWGEKLTSSIGLLSATKGALESKFSVALFFVVLGCLLFVRRRGARSVGIGVDVCFLLTLASIFVLPLDFNGQTVSRRHIDLSLWLLPLVVVDLVPRRPRGVAALALAGLFAFSVARVGYVAKHLQRLNADDFDGLVAIGEDCARLRPEPGSSRLAYAALGFESQYFHGRALHQAHETVAALCGIDTPVYDAQKYPHNLLPLRYKGALPAPVTILSRRPPNAGLFRQFDYVLVQGWNVSPEEKATVLPNAERVAKRGAFELWRRR